MNFFTKQSGAIDEGYSWVILLATSWLSSIVYGIIHISGIFFNVWLEEFKMTRESASWILTIPMLLLYILSPVVSIAWRKLKSAKAVSLAAMLLIPTSLLMSSHVYEQHMLLVTHGVLLGLGITCLVPCQVMLVRYFKKHLSVALAILTSCSYLGNLTLLPLTNFLLEKLNWRVTMRWLSFIALVAGAPSVFFFREHASAQNIPSSRRNFVALLKSGRFWVVMTSFVVLSVEYQTLSTHLVEYAFEMGITNIENVRMLPIYGAIGNVAGRLLIGYLMSKLSRKLLFYKITLIITSMSAFMGMYCRNLELMIVFLVIYGFFEGGSKAQMALVIVETLGEQVFSEAYTLIMMFQTMFMVSGPVVVAKVVDVTGNYVFMIYVLTAVPALATFVLQCVGCFRRIENYEGILDNNNEA